MHPELPELRTQTAYGPSEVCVAVCTRDRAHRLRSTLDSLARQTDPTFEVLVVIQGQEVDPDLMDFGAGAPGITFVRDSGHGISRARNLAWRQTETKWLVFVDDDCQLHPDWISTFKRTVRNRDDCCFVTGEIVPNELPSGPYLPIGVVKVKAQRKRRGRWTPPLSIGPGACFGVRRATVAELNGWDERLGAGSRWFPGAEDEEFNYRLLRGGGTAISTPELRAAHQQWRAQAELVPLFRNYMIGRVAAVAGRGRLPHPDGVGSALFPLSTNSSWSLQPPGSCPWMLQGLADNLVSLDPTLSERETSLVTSAMNCVPIFIVGCPRSGTTLLRLMLDSHPGIAIPDESHFVAHLHREWGAARRTPEMILERVVAHGRFARWGIDPNEVRRLAAKTRPSSYGEVMRTVFATYALSTGKVRWGDKSPPYVTQLPFLANLFPDALFIHIIRDGREVAASLAAHPWGPSGVIGAASFWKRRVSAGREAGHSLPPAHYLEVKLEDLITDPESVLRGVCDFVHEPFNRKMLDYPRTGQQRVWTGDPSIPGNYVDHRHVLLPPTPGLRDWRVGLSIAKQRAVEAATQPLLAELGYGTSPATRRTKVLVAADRLCRLPHSSRQLARTHLRPIAAGIRFRPSRLAVAARTGAEISATGRSPAGGR